MWKDIRNLILFLVILLITTACATPKSPMNPQKQVDLIKSDLYREINPSVDQVAITNLTSGQLNFALDLYQKLHTENGNLFFSPHSLHTVFAMAYAGARGQTERQIAGVMHYDLPQTDLHKVENALDQSLNSTGSEEDRFTLNVANAIWGQQDYPFNQVYLDTLAMNYDAGLRLADFLNAEGRSKAVQNINNWVKTETQDIIEKIIEQDYLTADTRLVLVNAIYFNGEWIKPFLPMTADMPFFRLDGSQVTPNWMERETHTRYTELDNIQAVELPYKGDRISMLILVPNAGEFEQFEESLDVDTIQKISSQLLTVNVSLVMPKFAFNTNYRLKEFLSSMGMSQAFDPLQADFSGMLDPQAMLEKLSISEVLHVADVKVDENGTEAAAASAIIMQALAMRTQTQYLMIDRPFIFLILDRETGAVLFLGRVLDPTA